MHTPAVRFELTGPSRLKDEPSRLKKPAPVSLRLGKRRRWRDALDDDCRAVRDGGHDAVGQWAVPSGRHTGLGICDYRVTSRRLDRKYQDDIGEHLLSGIKWLPMDTFRVERLGQINHALAAAMARLGGPGREPVP